MDVRSGRLKRRPINCKDCSHADRCFPSLLDDDEVEPFDAMVRRRRPLARGGLLFRQDEPFRSLFAIRAGSLKRYYIAEDGVEQITGFLFPGELVGLIGMVANVYPVSAKSLEETFLCEVFFDPLYASSQKAPKLQKKVMRSLSREIQEDQQLIWLISRKTAEQRVAAFLVNLSARLRSRGFSTSSIRLSMSRTEISNYLGIAMETVSRVLAGLQDDGFIVVSGKRLEVLDWLGLCGLASGNRDRLGLR
ncbi:fumarate/nitrate reduction transcriptional regulator Fnr [Pseudomonas aeruginosa]|uniref:fumarate/nitrate reduction transcriptional regulator Fnr n=1 Tax=Pseudomonas aeruginosa TaxID=287 RepID=UPI000FC4094A|nr:fumarate/nitrate reduction transcriptional regulator Fnr [Pseudomonas aeruginosa]MBW6122471.1 fumarate/nitrate reduction transcriptional regulator Fnr [Pseudomonas aeruginosa]MCV3954640.1 fumarate/nitrate reduction transcriptional regulator Fnr [Pseudomonas aeruginosa]QKF01908.1 fumarate/nitrate reduction transcriptional regulator Fnr [Pseudomonas aeruginosa]RUE61519.1 fumarate/nitrate reduction transcriptional regulator Fnr [Pseudomonas aeruginosa]HBO2781242.1 fumarate/nitrate reduction tr